MSDQETTLVAPELVETFTPEQIRSAIRAFLEYGEHEYQESHHGYFSGPGFAARALRFHLNQLLSSSYVDKLSAQVKSGTMQS